MSNDQGSTVLIVEDNPDNMFLTTQLLRRILSVGYVNARASGRQLFRLLDTTPHLTPDLILLDLQLPYEDGYTILKQIRQDPRLTTTRVVALTANVMPDDVKSAMQAGFDGFIGKPISFKRFPEQIQRILNGETLWEPR